MKKILLFVVTGVLALTGCQSDEEGGSVNAISLGAPSKTQFDHRGGLGSVDVYAGNKTVTAESSNPEWCPVTVFDNRTIAFNLYENLGDKERTATVTVSAEGLPSEQFSVTQDRLKGLVITPTTLNFTSDRRTISVEIIASCAYEIVAEANPDETFSWKKSADGKVVDFTSKDPGNYEVDGRVLFVPEAGEQDAQEYISSVSSLPYVREARLVTREEGEKELAEMLGVKTPLKLRLASMDAPLAPKVIEKTQAFNGDIVMTADADPAPILGGCWVITADGHKQVDMDWQSVTQEHADTLAERLLPLL